MLLEEMERTFIRRIGGFEGLRALLEWISSTSTNTLWILSLNETAFRFLDRVMGLGEAFSHRINAMAVAPDHLQNAILLRHNLSGLRLEFAPSAAANARTAKIRRLFGLEKDPEQLVFESLYKQSQGIFRSAFELWQQSVDRVEGGVLYMLEAKESNYEGMISRLTLEDSFLLQAITQHGSLTPEEVSLIFDYTLKKSRSRLDKLLGWEVLEPDPRCPGFRVQPEAGRMVAALLTSGATAALSSSACWSAWTGRPALSACCAMRGRWREPLTAKSCCRPYLNWTSKRPVSRSIWERSQKR